MTNSIKNHKELESTQAVTLHDHTNTT